MTSDAQRNANKRNAQRSTGPRTPDGKARASANALRHGAFSSRVDPVVSTILGENASDLQTLVEAVIEELDPQSSLGVALARTVAIRAVDQHRAHQLASPLLNGCETTDEQRLALCPSAWEVRFGEALLVLLDMLDGGPTQDINWTQLWFDLLERVETERSYALGHTWPNGEHRGPISDEEWLIVFRGPIGEIFDDLDDGREYASAHIQRFLPQAEEEARQMWSLEARRLLEGIENVSKLQDRVDRGLTRALAAYDSFQSRSDSRADEED